MNTTITNNADCSSFRQTEYDSVVLTNVRTFDPQLWHIDYPCPGTPACIQAVMPESRCRVYPAFFENWMPNIALIRIKGCWASSDLVFTVVKDMGFPLITSRNKGGMGRSRRLLAGTQRPFAFIPNLPTKLTGFISGIARQHANANTDKPQRRN